MASRKATRPPVPETPAWSEPDDLASFAREVLGDDLGRQWLDTEQPLLDRRKPKDTVGRPEEAIARDVLRSLLVGAA